ncbi:phosphatase PAP2 family protein [Mycobacterium sp. RTGN5]|uniref:phosphatase PAP2 family protein n=1 Tax=Mycobacterium sp. RTGN5 TaxID=3016522 RepID=UPI0029C8E27C|nr:phosphatase PAP2 family protein [Mycobacterium sp. RTGN5]
MSSNLTEGTSNSRSLTSGTMLAIGTTFARPRLALVLLSAGLFGVLAFLAVEVNSWWLTLLDTSVWNWFDAHRSHRGQGDSLGIFAYIGQPVHVAVAGLVSGTLLSLQARSAMRLVVVTGAVGAGAAIEQTLKAIVERTPQNLSQLRNGPVLDWSIVDYYAHSFPSGHVTGSATLFGMSAVCLAAGRSRAVRTAISGAAVTGVVAVSWLALYVRAHIFTDVIGGMVLGGAIVALCAAAIVLPNRTV